MQINKPNNPQADPLKKTYVESIIKNSGHGTSLKTQDTALLCIDLQYLDAAPGYGVFKDVTESGVPLESQLYYFNTLSDYVLKNVNTLQQIFRQNKLEVIHTRIQCLTNDGRDRGAGHKRLGLIATPGSKEAEFLPEVAPIENEIVMNKTASGVFSSTNLHYVLNNIGINSLYLVGVYTNECVETTARDACDLGYFVTIVEDCCTTVTPELQYASLASLRDRYVRVQNLKEAISEINKHIN